MLPAKKKTLKGAKHKIGKPVFELDKDPNLSNHMRMQIRQKARQDARS